MLSNPNNSHKHSINPRTNKNIIKRIKYWYNIEINFNQLCYTKCHQQIPFTCLPNACMHTHTKCSWCRAIFRWIRVTQTIMDPYGPWALYTPYGHISLNILHVFPLFLFPKRHYHFPHHRQLHDRLFHHHSIMYICPHPPIFSYMLYILLLFVKTFSP